MLSEATAEQIVFSAFDPLQGRKGQVAKIDSDSTDTFWDLSPDGSKIAFGQFESNRGMIRIVPLGGGAAREIEVKGWFHLNSVAWSADGKSLFVTKWGSKAGSVIWIDMNGETRSPPVTAYSVERPLPSPDGRRLAFSVATPIECNAWMLENF